MKKSRKILITLGTLMGVLFLVVLFGISPFAKYYVEKHGKELVGRRVTVEKVRFNLLNGKLRIDNFTLYEPDDATRFVAMNRFATDLKLRSLLKRHINIRYIDLVRPDVHITQHGNSFNFDDMVTHFQSDTTAVEQVDTLTVEESAPWIIEIDSITIRNGKMLYEDQQVEAQWGFNDLNIYIPSVYFTGKSTDVGIGFDFAEGGSLNTNLAYNIESNDFDLSVEINRLALSTVLPYFRQTLNLSAVEGDLTADVNLTGNLGFIMGFSIAGTADLENFSLHDVKEREVFALESGHLEVDSVDFVNNSFHLGRLAFEGLRGGYEIFADSTTNFTGLVKEISERGLEEDAAVSVKVDSTEHDPLKLHIRELSLKRSNFRFADNTLHKPFVYNITNIGLLGRDFDLEKMNNITAQATLQSTGSARLRWQGTFTSLANHNITLMLSNVAMKDFSPYCEAFTAHPITQGNLSFESQNIITNYQLVGANKLDTYQFSIDKKLKEIDPSVKLPLKLGVYVLTDKTGHINLDLPVKGRIDDPEFSYRKIIFKALGNVLLKVATAPFSFLKGKGDDGFSSVAINEPLKPGFDAEQYATFDQIAATLKEKPEMKARLTQKINIDEATDAMALFALKAAYYKRTSGDSTSMLNLVDYDRIMAIKDNSSELNAYADSELQQRNIASQKRSIQEKAEQLYGNVAHTQVVRVAEVRNRILGDYMLQKQQVSAEQFSIAPFAPDSLPSAGGKDRYAITVEIEGEEIALEEPTQAEEITATPEEQTPTTSQEP
ncbi:MAG: DUF748 domain-containing protein [Rikenellaceae bacterium]|nr:DUF748 domain-containing protein [Rikenellaceae bacterium]